MSGCLCRFPALRLSPNLAGCHHPSDPVTRSDYNHSSRVSAYDNVVNNNNHKPVSVCLNGSGNSDNDDALVSTPDLNWSSIVYLEKTKKEHCV